MWDTICRYTFPSFPPYLPLTSSPIHRGEADSPDLSRGRSDIKSAREKALFDSRTDHDLVLIKRSKSEISGVVSYLVRACCVPSRPCIPPRTRCPPQASLC